jgi:hypothetical protein
VPIKAAILRASNQPLTIEEVEIVLRNIHDEGTGERNRKRRSFSRRPEWSGGTRRTGPFTSFRAAASGRLGQLRASAAGT